MIGDQTDIIGRIDEGLPSQWFGDDKPFADMLVTGYGEQGAYAYQLYEFAKLQTRINTATGIFLDMISADFFGGDLPRVAAESDSLFRIRIIANLFRKKVTLYALQDALTLAVPSINPRATFMIFEPGQHSILDSAGAAITDSTGDGLLTTSDASTLIPNGAYPIGISTADASARYGTPLAAFECLVNISGLPQSASGYNDSPGGYGSYGYTRYMGLSPYTSAVGIELLYKVISSVKPIATTVWVVFT
jgi:hypothetical protein